MKPTIAITFGDPGGIGPEVALKACRDRKILKAAKLVLISTESVLKSNLNMLSLSAPIHRLSPENFYLKSEKLNFIDLHRFCSIKSKAGTGTEFLRGKIAKQNAAIALASLDVATHLALQKKVDAIVTAPIHKTAMRLVMPGFHGHTEYFADRAGVKDYAMMFAGEKLKLTLVTIHEPIKKVASLITARQVYQKIRLTDDFLKKHFGILRPKIAVCALNPHGKETGQEENQKIFPAVKKAQKEGRKISGPFSADQLFYEAYHGRYDALICMYHDQGLAPFKMVSFHDGVNVTLGLPFIRTSPDHGTAFDKAYKNTADPRSMRSAIDLAIRLASQKKN